MPTLLMDFSSENAKVRKRASKGAKGMENSWMGGVEEGCASCPASSPGLGANMLCRHLCLCPCDSPTW